MTLGRAQRGLLGLSPAGLQGTCQTLLRKAPAAPETSRAEQDDPSSHHTYMHSNRISAGHVSLSLSQAPSPNSSGGCLAAGKQTIPCSSIRQQDSARCPVIPLEDKGSTRLTCSGFLAGPEPHSHPPTLMLRHAWRVSRQQETLSECWTAGLLPQEVQSLLCCTPGLD